MTAAPSVYLLRHTRVADPSVCYGHHEMGLAESFEEDATAAATKLLAAIGGWESLVPARVISSPAARCRRLAAGLRPFSLLHTLEYDERLREMHFGTWEGRPWADVPLTELDHWRADYVTLAPPGGETFQQVQDRAAALLAELTTATTATVLVSHGGLIRALLCSCLDMPLRHAFRFAIDYGSLTELRWQGTHWQVARVNA